MLPYIHLPVTLMIDPTMVIGCPLSRGLSGLGIRSFSPTPSRTISSKMSASFSLKKREIGTLLEVSRIVEGESRSRNKYLYTDDQVSSARTSWCRKDHPRCVCSAWQGLLELMVATAVASEMKLDIYVVNPAARG
jgi:hypothetical protein